MKAWLANHRRAAASALRALAALRGQLGGLDLVADLGTNPLPDAFVAKLRIPGPAPDGVWVGELRKLPRVESVLLDSEWVQRLDALLRAGRTLALAMAGALVVALLAGLFSSVRLQLLARRDEVEVARILGATRGFVRRPFLYLGLFEGAAAGLLACLLLAGIGGWVAQEVAPLFRSYGWQPPIGVPAVADILLLIAIGALLGIVAAALAAWRA